MRVAAIAVVDLALIVAFAALGRRSHDDDAGLTATVTIAAPFLIGYVVAAVALRLDRAPLQIGRGAVVAAVAVGLGLALRGTVFDRGLAPAFVVVAFVTITALLAGWRLIAKRVAARGRGTPQGA